MIQPYLPPDLDAVGNYRLLRLLAEISSKLVALPSEQMDDAIEDTLRLIVGTLEIDRSTLWQITDDRAGLMPSHHWQQSECPPLSPKLDAAALLPWSHGKVMRGEAFHFNCLEELPAEAARDVEAFRLRGPVANVTVPLFCNGGVFGAMTFGRLSHPRRWSRDEIDALQLIAGMFGGILCRRRAEFRAEQLRSELARVSRASMLGEFAANIAHELNQPLAAILGNAQAARRFLSKGLMDPVELTEILDDIIRDDKRANDVILNLRHLLEGTGSTRETCCVNALVTETCGFLRKRPASERIVVKLAVRELQVRAAPAEIQQVLINLVRNATQAMDALPPEHRKVRVETSGCNGNAVVRVVDRGCGFPEGQMERMLEPFHSNRPGGLGMGLAICRRIIDSHGGTIQARNRSSGGAEFSFSLPLFGSQG